MDWNDCFWSTHSQYGRIIIATIHIAICIHWFMISLAFPLSSLSVCLVFTFNVHIPMVDISVPLTYTIPQNAQNLNLICSQKRVNILSSSINISPRWGYTKAIKTFNMNVRDAMNCVTTNSTTLKR